MMPRTVNKGCRSIVRRYGDWERPQEMRLGRWIIRCSAYQSMTVSTVGPTREETRSLSEGRLEKIISFSTWAISPCWASDTIRALTKACQHLDTASTNGRTYLSQPVLIGYLPSSGASELVQKRLVYSSTVRRWFQVVAD